MIEQSDNFNNIEEKFLNLYNKVRKLEQKKEDVNKNLFKGVYMFVSFDLVNSTKIKYRDEKWLRLINELITIANNEWFGLRFWKFNGDEILYYAQIDGINQIASILHQLHKKSSYFQDKLLKSLSNDKSLGFARDLVGLKVAAWLAYVSNDEDCFNSELNTIDSIDFAGINMDEGFRMSKCAIQNKIIVDPKIALLLCLAANEIYGKKIANLDTIIKNSIMNRISLNSLEDIFTKFWLVQEKENQIDFEHEDLFRVVSNNLRIINYENCKGVWDDRPYPIIWYSDNWDATIESSKYDEMYLDMPVTKNLISQYYQDSENPFLDTLKTLYKIYTDVTPFRLVINKILLECNFHLWTNAQMNKQYTSKTYLYYSVVCINKKDNSVLVFLRHNKRGHLPNVWDFEQQKPAQTLNSTNTISQIENTFYDNFGVKIKVVKDHVKNSLIPMDVHPIYRRGKIHHGVLCFAYIDNSENFSETEILKTIKRNLPNVKSSYGYPLYSDVSFVHINDICIEPDTYTTINGEKIEELSYKRLLKDSNSWNNHKKGESLKNTSTPNFTVTIFDALNYKEVTRPLNFTYRVGNKEINDVGDDDSGRV